MAVEIPKEKWSGKIEEIVIGATKEEGGTRTRQVKIGGESVLPFLHFDDGTFPNRPAIAMEVYDIVPEYPEPLKSALEHYLGHPGKWAKFAVEQCNVDLICLKLKGTDPEGENRSVDDAIDTLQDVLGAVGVPLLVYGSGNEDKDAKVMQACGELLRNERCVIGLAEQDKYKSLAVAAMAYDQYLVAFSNLDINLAKQLNILLTDFGVKKNKIIMDPLMGGLGYGLEYSYSVIERIRLAAFQGDSILQVPIVCDMTRAWLAREASEERPEIGDRNLRGPLWEATTALAAIMAGADMLIMSHPKAVKMLQTTLNQLMNHVKDD
jgi:acetyl-CoA decarbonylase/synthase complex subunit delta